MDNDLEKRLMAIERELQAIKKLLTRPSEHSLEQAVPDNKEAMLSVKQITKLLAINRETWRRWCRSGHAPAPMDLPGHPRWRRADIDRFAQGLQRVGRTYFGSHRRRW